MTGVWYRKRCTLGNQRGFTLIELGTVPSVLSLLTAIATNAQSISAGPFMAVIPMPPSTAWGSADNYATNANGTLTISAAGDGATVSAR